MKTKKILSVLLATIMMVSVLPCVSVAAADTAAPTTTKKTVAIGTNALTNTPQSHIYLGRYQQTSAGSTEPEGTEGVDWVYSDSAKAQARNVGPYYTIDPIQWRVLSEGSDKQLLISEKNLDTALYHEDNEAVTWETSTARSWLNGYGASENSGGSNGIDYSTNNFIDAVFSESEQALICSTTVINDDNPEYRTEGGNNTTDQLFFLSMAEAQKAYSKNYESGIALDTDYTYGGGSINMTTRLDRQDSWWLRSPGKKTNYAANFSLGNGIYVDGINVNSEGFTARPAFYLDSSQVLFTVPTIGGKSQTTGLQPTTSYSGDDYKLTVFDDSRYFLISNTSERNVTHGETLEMRYELATQGDNEYISAMLVDDKDEVLYYGRLQEVRTKSGTARLTIPTDLDYGTYTLNVFNEQINGDYEIDYASRFSSISITLAEPTPTTDKYDLNGDGKKDSVYEISNAQEFYWFAKFVNSGNPNTYGVLTQDIDLGNKKWYPIGLYQDPAEEGGTAKTVQYNGYFDGQKHKVSNFTAAGNGSQALFGYCTQSATIRNLGVEHATVSGWNAAAVLAFNGRLENCYAYDCHLTATTTNTTATTLYGGAVAGYNAYKLDSCYAYNCQVDVGAVISNVTAKKIVTVGGGTNTNVTNCYFYNVTTNDSFSVNSYAQEKTQAAFASGEVANDLQNGRNPSPWGQELGSDAYPVLGGSRVYKVTFAVADEVYDARFSNYGGTVTLPENPIKGGYEFLRWSQTQSPDGEAFTAETAVTANDTAFAVFSEITQNTGVNNMITAKVGDSININLNDYVQNVSGATKNFSFSRKQNFLPSGLTLEDGIISGTASAAASTSVTFGVVNNGFAPMSAEDRVDEITLHFDIELSGTGTSTDPYLIQSVNDLEYFRDKVNRGKSYEGEYVKLGQNAIHLSSYGKGKGQDGSDVSWMPIGLSAGSAFKGTFDGNDRSISRLYIADPVGSTQGLFGYIGAGAKIKNLTVSGEVKGGMYVGGVVAVNKGGTVENCHFVGEVSGTDAFVGGVVGVNVEGVVTQCSNAGTVNGAQTAVSYYIGGVVGDSNKGSVTNCYNTGIVVGYETVGGVVGHISENNSVTNCYNSGAVSGERTIGGVVGYVDTAGSLTGCYNIGTVQGTTAVGGIAGANNSTVKTSYNSGDVSGDNGVGGICGVCYATVSTCYNVGRVSAIAEFGAVVGSGTSGVSDCYYLDSCIAANNGAGNALTETQLKNVASFSGWDFTETWVMGSRMPLLKAIQEEHTANNPDRMIYTLDDMKAFRDAVNQHDVRTSEYILLMNDIDLGGSEDNQWKPIGYSDRFSFEATFDGNGHKITGLYINDSTKIGQGLFGYIFSGAIYNLGVYGTVNVRREVGGLAGHTTGSRIINCYNGCTVSGAEGYVGGLIGKSVGGTVIYNSYNIGTVSGGRSYTGGLTGYEQSSDIRRCYNMGQVSGVSYVGGLAGQTDSGSFINCYNTAAINGTADFVGGIVGYNTSTLQNCYNIGSVASQIESDGGVTAYGYSNKAPIDSYYLAGCALHGSNFGTAISAEALATQTTFANWNLSAEWEMGEKRPMLRQNPECNTFLIWKNGTTEDKTTADVFIPTAGSYTVVFADYEAGKLNGVETVTVTVAENTLGTRTVTALNDVTLGADDKVMLIAADGTLKPLCAAYQVK